MKKIILFFCIVYIFCGCAKPTLALIEEKYSNITYRSTKSVAGSSYLWLNVNVGGDTLTFWIADETAMTIPDNADKITGDSNIGGVDPNYSFYSGNIYGSLSFAETEVTVSIIKNSEPYFSFRNIKCRKYEATAAY